MCVCTQVSGSPYGSGGGVVRDRLHGGVVYVSGSVPRGGFSGVGGWGVLRNM